MRRLVIRIRVVIDEAEGGAMLTYRHYVVLSYFQSSSDWQVMGPSVHESGCACFVPSRYCVSLRRTIESCRSR